MKYPKQQFEVLKDAIKVLAPLMNVKEANPYTLHYIIFQQFSEGQSHNWLYCCPVIGLQRAHKIKDSTGCQKLITAKFNFELYPNDCNDDNIGTAMKAALKELNLWAYLD